MREISVHEFRSHLREQVEEVVEDHVPLRVKRRGGQDFVVLSAEDWEREQETLYILQNKSLMEQIERSLTKTLLGIYHGRIAYPSSMGGSSGAGGMQYPQPTAAARTA